MRNGNQNESPEGHAMAEAEAMRSADEKGNLFLYGQTDAPIAIEGKPQTLADLIKSDFANIWTNAEAKQR
jgi:hypothetical protein